MTLKNSITSHEKLFASTAAPYRQKPNLKPSISYRKLIIYDTNLKYWIIVKNVITDIMEKFNKITSNTLKVQENTQVPSSDIIMPRCGYSSVSEA